MSDYTPTNVEIGVKIRGVNDSGIIVQEEISKKKRTLSVDDPELVDEISQYALPIKRQVVLRGNKVVAIRRDS